jgi:CBS domain-containing protein
MANSDLVEPAEVVGAPRRWANSSIGDEPHVTLEALQKGLTVSLIATGRAAFEFCVRDERLADVVGRNRKNQFDFLPVVDAATNNVATSGKIIGLVHISAYRNGTKIDGRISAVMQPLSEENLIGADASILTFVRDADRHRCRLIVSGHEISGLVTLSDLQRSPVRAALFGLVTHLEIIMTEVIRRESGGTDDWFDRLSPGRQQKVREEIYKAQRTDRFVDALLFTQIVDKATIIRRSPRLINGKIREREVKKIEMLRNSLAHANDYAQSPDAAKQTCEAVRLIETWSKHFSQWLKDIEPR